MVRNLITRVHEHIECLIKDKESSVGDHSKRYKDKSKMNKKLKSELFCLLKGQKTKDKI